MIDNIICYLDSEGELFINASLPCYEHGLYFKIEEPFEIKETGVYKKVYFQTRALTFKNLNNIYLEKLKAVINTKNKD